MAEGVMTSPEAGVRLHGRCDEGKKGKRNTHFLFDGFFSHDAVGFEVGSRPLWLQLVTAVLFFFTSY